MKYASICSGIEAPTAAWYGLGWTPSWFSEIDPFCCALLDHWYPEVPNHEDVTRIDWNTVEGPDLLAGGTPCFPAGILILRRDGYVPIEQVRVGDEVLTHVNRWRRVSAIGSKVVPELLRIKGGGTHVLQVTPDHPILTSVMSRHQPAVGTKRRVYGADVAWRPARDVKGCRWASPARVPASEPPPVFTEGREVHVPGFSDDFFWFVGAWLGDGWCRFRRTKADVLIADDHEDALTVRDCAERAGLHACTSRQRSTTRVQVSSRPLARWLIGNFGHGAYGKRLPGWTFGMQMSWRRALLDGYLFADGCDRRNGTHRLATVSRELAFGAALLAQTLGLAVGIDRNDPGGVSTIDGRDVVRSPWWTVRLSPHLRTAHVVDDKVWYAVSRGRYREPIAGPVLVHNLEVEEDNSYVADGIVVHNCQGLSVSGRRGGFRDPRSALVWSFVDALDALRPRWFLWENVPGVLSSDGGRDLGAFLWEVAKLGYDHAFRILDAQFFGLAQRRERVFVVGRLGGGAAAFAVLHESESLRGDPGTGRKAKTVVARATARRVGVRGSARERLIGAAQCHGSNVAPPGALRAGNGGLTGGVPFVAVDRAARTLLPKHDDSHDEALETYVVGDRRSDRVEIAPVVDCRAGNGPRGQGSHVAIVGEIAHTLRGSGYDASEDGSGRGTPLVAFGGGNTSGSIDVATCQTSHGVRMDFDTETFVVGSGEPVVALAFAQNSRDEVRLENGDGAIVGSLKTGGGKPGQSYPVALSFDNRQDPLVHEDGSSRPLGAKDNGQGVLCWSPDSGSRIDGRNRAEGGRGVRPIVRRLTPLECERLMGFPDDYTAIPFRGGIGKQRDADELIAYFRRRHPDWSEEYVRTLAADGPRYRSLGNSIAVPVLAWIGRRIGLVEECLRREGLE